MTVMDGGPTCGKIVEGNAVSYMCTIEAGHDGPCAAIENQRSMRERTAWEAERRATESGLSQFQGTPQTTAQRYTENPTDVPETASERVERQHAEARARAAQQAQQARPQVLVDNDDAIRAGELHNPYDVACQRRDDSGPVLPEERCFICRPPVVPTSEPERPVRESCPHDFCHANFAHRHEEGGPIFEPKVLRPVEEGLGHPVLPEFRETVQQVAVEQVQREQDREIEPTKQREGDQVLPTPTGGEYVQDRIIGKIRTLVSRGQIEPASAEGIIAQMEESKRVGTERYGTPLQIFNGRDSLQDLVDELRDAFVYGNQMMQSREQDRSVLVPMLRDAMHEQWMAWANDGQKRTPTEYCQSLAEIAIDTLLRATGPITPVSRG